MPSIRFVRGKWRKIDPKPAPAPPPSVEFRLADIERDIRDIKALLNSPLIAEAMMRDNLRVNSRRVPTR
jgi:hypothetical protein